MTEIGQTPEAPANLEPVRRTFDSGAAAFHVFVHAREAGWRGLIGLGAVYLVFNIVVTGLVLWGMWPFLEFVFDPAFSEQAANRAAPPPGFLAAFGQFMAVWPVFMLVWIVFYAMMDAALLRWLYGRGAKLRMDGTMLRLVVVLIFWCVLPVVVFLPPWIALGVSIALGQIVSTPVVVVLAIITTLLFLAALPLWFWVATRFAPAAALTVHDGRLRVFAAWSASRGRFWSVFGGFVIVWLVYIGASVALQILMQPAMMMAGLSSFMSGPFAAPGAPPPDMAELLAIFTSPAMIVIFAISTLISVIIAFFMQAMLAGVNALAVKTSR